MAETITAIYEHGVLRPTIPLDLPERTEVQVTIVGATPLDVREANRRRVEQALATAGLLASQAPLPSDVQPLNEEERAGLAQRLGTTSGKPLSEIVIEEREDRI